jgi:hypothetical protein
VYELGFGPKIEMLAHSSIAKHFWVKTQKNYPDWTWWSKERMLTEFVICDDIKVILYPWLEIQFLMADMTRLYLHTRGMNQSNYHLQYDLVLPWKKYLESKWDRLLITAYSFGCVHTFLSWYKTRCFGRVYT